MNKLMVLVSGFILILGCGGCANYVKTVTVSDEIKRIDKENNQYQIKINEQEFEKGYFQAQVLFNQATDFTRINVFQEKKYYTPYKWWREFYEVPTGVLLLPCGFALQLMDIALLGMIPNNTIEATWDYSFSGMNPFLNMESSKRFEIREGHKEEKELGKEQMIQSHPAENEVLQIVCGDKIWEYTLNEKGEMASSVMKNERIRDLLQAREIHFKMKEKPESQITFVLSRRLRERFKKAEQIIKEYRLAPSGAALAKCVLSIEDIEFPRLALMLEKEELKKNENNKAFKEEFELEVEK